MTKILKKELVFLLNTYFEVRLPLLLKVMRDQAFEQFSDDSVSRPDMTDLSNLKNILISQMEEGLNAISAKSTEIWIKESSKNSD